MFNGKKTDFFINYGWMILVIIAVISGWFYFGVISPDSMANVNVWCAEKICTDEGLVLYDRDIDHVICKPEGTLRQRNKSEFYQIDYVRFVVDDKTGCDKYQNRNS